MNTKQIFMVLLLLGGNAAQADEFLPGNAAKGKVLHNRDCVSCHDSSVYTRPNRINSLGGLQKRVEMCSTMLKKPYSREDEENLVKYLNESYYKFKSE